MPRRRPPAARPAAADPDTALIHVRHAEAVLRAAQRQDAAVRARAAESAAKVEAAQADLQAAQTAARAAARVARRAGRTLAYATHPSALPADILVSIASLLSQSDALSMACTCTDWRNALLASPSPIFRSVRFRFEKLVKGTTELPMVDTLKNRAPDVMALELSGPKIKRDHAWVASLLPSFTRLTSLSYQTSTQRSSWIGLPLAAAGASCPGLVSVAILSRAKRAPPSPADIFRSLGAALARMTHISFQTDWDATLNAGHEQSATPWLEPATALRELNWQASALPVLPATVALRSLKLNHQLRTVPPAALTPGFSSVRHVVMDVAYTNVADAVLRRATRLTRFESSEGARTMLPLIATLSSLRELSWGLNLPSIMPAAALPALTAMQLRTFSLGAEPLSISVEPGTLDAFAALRSLHIKVYGPYASSNPLTMPPLGPNFAPHLTSLSLESAALDLATVAFTWEAESLRELILESVKLIVNAANVPANADADGALGAARAAAAAAAAALDSAEQERWLTAGHVEALLGHVDIEDLNGEPVFEVEALRVAYRAAVAADAAALAAQSRARAAENAAYRRVTKCVDELVARSLPAALPAVTRVTFRRCRTEPWATAAADALEAFNSRTVRRGRRAEV